MVESFAAFCHYGLSSIIVHYIRYFRARLLLSISFGALESTVGVSVYLNL